MKARTYLSLLRYLRMPSRTPDDHYNRFERRPPVDRDDWHWIAVIAVVGVILGIVAGNSIAPPADAPVAEARK